jgi:hypothetical protein
MSMGTWCCCSPIHAREAESYFGAFTSTTYMLARTGAVSLFEPRIVLDEAPIGIEIQCHALGGDGVGGQQHTSKSEQDGTGGGQGLGHACDGTQYPRALQVRTFTRETSRPRRHHRS